MRVLMIEDDEKLSQILSDRLRENQCFCDCCYRGDDAVLYIEKENYDVIVLDRMLPGLDGLSVLKKIRENKIATPVILVTAMNQLENRIEGLDGGADDYLTKPFEMEEFLARIRALGRRTAPLRVSDELSFGDLRFNKDQMCIETEHGSCRLTKREADLMTFLMKNHDRVLSRELLLDRIWGVDNDVMDCNLDNFIYFLRKRLKNVKSRLNIKTVRGVGYRLEEKHD